ncbi:hypothetical protein HDV01_004814 [Terramyces sp. JEL0728]|nr:hypothetical protein HDV01_004814 [Terramyces sp. JEL0728]
MDASESESKKRPLPVKDELREPDSKKVRVDHVESSPKFPPIKLSPMLGKNKPQVTRTLKVIPPKDPGVAKEKGLESYTLKVPQSDHEETKDTTVQEPPEIVEQVETKEGIPAENPISPEIKVEGAKENSDESAKQKADKDKPKESTAKSKEITNKPNQADGSKENEVNAEPKKGEAKKSEAKKPSAIELKLSKMELGHDIKEIIALLDGVKNKLGRDSIIINDKRLCTKDHANSSTFLGHVNYTGAKSRTAHSNRAVDLDLFLIPPFTKAHHFAALEVRIPAEFLSYRGNIAVRKSAIWGTDIYTDDSDVVASKMR